VAFIEKRIGKRGVRYRVRVRDPVTGELLSKTFDLKKEAEQWLHSMEADKDANRWRDRRAASEPLYNVVVKNISTALDLSAATKVLYQGTADRYIKERIGRRLIGTISAANVRGWIAELVQAGVGVRTIQLARVVVGRALGQAEAERVIESNPVKFAPAPRGGGGNKVRVLEIHEVDAIAGSIDPRYRALVITAAWCGLRFGEVAALRLSDLDMLHRRLVVSRALAEVAGVVTEGPTKSGKARTVPMPKVVVVALGEHLATVCRDHDPAQHDDHLLFTDPAGGPIRRTNWRRRAWAPAVAKVGIDRVTPHALRHFGAAVAIAAGAHPKMIQERLGHASITTTLNIYGRLLPSLDEDLMNKLDAIAAEAQESRGAAVVPLKR
jgi:integrase